MPGVRYPPSEGSIIRRRPYLTVGPWSAEEPGGFTRPPGTVMPVGPQCRRPVSGRLSRPVACPGSPGPYRGPDPEWRCAPGLPAPRPRGRAPHGRYPYLARLTSAKSSVPCTAACPRNTSAGQDRRCRRRTPSRGPGNLVPHNQQDCTAGFARETIERSSPAMFGPPPGSIRPASPGTGPANSQPRARPTQQPFPKCGTPTGPRPRTLQDAVSRNSAGAPSRPRRDSSEPGAGAAMRSLTSSWPADRTGARARG